MKNKFREGEEETDLRGREKKKTRLYRRLNALIKASTYWIEEEKSN